MNGVNKVIIVGNLGADPEARYTADGNAVTNIRVATTDKWKDKESGEVKESTEWHRIVFFGRIAEVAAKYLKKGSPCYVEGKLKARKWQDKEGADRYSTEEIDGSKVYDFWKAGRHQDLRDYCEWDVRRARWFTG